MDKPWFRMAARAWSEATKLVGLTTTESVVVAFLIQATIAVIIFFALGTTAFADAIGVRVATAAAPFALLPLLFAWKWIALPPALAKEISHLSSGVPAVQSPPTPRGAHYDARDRQIVRDALRELNTMLRDLAQVQVNVHAVAGRVRGSVGRPKSGEVVFALTSAKDYFEETRLRIGQRFENGRDDGNEAWAILGAGDPLNREIVAIEGVLKVMKSLSQSPDMSEFVESALSLLLTANAQLGDWISASLPRIDARRKELGGD